MDKLGIEYMLTGSMALVHYAMPRTTVDIDVVIDLEESRLKDFSEEFQDDYYFPPTAMKRAVRERKMFNAIEQETIVKIDCVVLKQGEFARTAFSRRRRVDYAGELEVSIISKEDLILSKLQWAKESDSDRQKRDIVGMLITDFDTEYVNTWAESLGVDGLLKELFEFSQQDDPERHIS
ncbi:MAG: hypothetical protein J5I65_14315 [Aridibacter famidurans]|nr:hypothetical protein [Aridibacter famidurans]